MLRLLPYLLVQPESLLQAAVTSSRWGRRKPARFRRSLTIWPLMETSSAVLEWRLHKHRRLKPLSTCVRVCLRVCVCVCLSPRGYVDLQNPGFKILIQHDVKTEQLVAAVRRLDIDLHQTENVRFWPDRRRINAKFIKNLERSLNGCSLLRTYAMMVLITMSLIFSQIRVVLTPLEPRYSHKAFKALEQLNTQRLGKVSEKLNLRYLF